MFVVFAKTERTVFVEIARIRTFLGASQEGLCSDESAEVLSFQRFQSHIGQMSPSRPCLAPKLHYL
jgi:hypothetical protein